LDEPLQLCIIVDVPDARIIRALQLSPGTAAKLPAICERFGCTQRTMVDRLMEWYAQLPAELRQQIVKAGADPRENTRAVVRQMMGKRR